MKICDFLKRYATISCRTDSLFACREFLASVLKIKNTDIFLRYDEELSEKDMLLVNRLMERFVSGEPVSKILHNRCFWEYEFFVTKDVLDPRPDSETMIEAILEIFENRLGDLCTILELGIGSGCLLFTLLKIFGHITGVGIDISKEAISVAQQNAIHLGLTERVRLDCQDWTKYSGKRYSVVISNPPYIKTSDIANLENNVKCYDPIIALDGGRDGLCAYRSIKKNLPKILDDGGIIFLEVGIDQSSDVCKIFEDSKNKILKIFRDLNGVERIIAIKNEL